MYNKTDGCFDCPTGRFFMILFQKARSGAGFVLLPILSENYDCNGNNYQNDSDDTPGGE